MPPSLDIIIVNWNAGQQLRDCLESVESARLDGFSLGRVVVVDNASSDGSLDGLDSLTLPLKIIRNSVNRGFGAACNQGAALCDASYLLFLNPDTVLFENSLAVPLAFMEDEANQDVGICGIQLVDEKGHVAHTCARFPTLWRFAAQAIGLNKVPLMGSTGVHMQDWMHSQTKMVDHVMGAFFLVRRCIFESLEGFDERYFVYFEDIDFSFRTGRDGWKSIYLADAQAYHIGGGTSRQVKATRLFYSLRSRLLYGFKFFPLWQAWILFGLILFIEPVSRTLFSLLRGGVRDVRNTWSGYSMLYRDLPNILVKLSGN